MLLLHTQIQPTRPKRLTHRQRADDKIEAMRLEQDEHEARARAAGLSPATAGRAPPALPRQPPAFPASAAWEYLMAAQVGGLV